MGWKGLINDPGLDGSGDVNTACASPYAARAATCCGWDSSVGDVASWTRSPRSTSRTRWRGARSAPHGGEPGAPAARSGSMPIGMKNRPDGSVSTAVDAIRAAGVPHVFPGIDVSGTRRSCTLGATRTATWCCAAAAAGRIRRGSRWRELWSCCERPACRAAVIDPATQQRQGPPQPAVVAPTWPPACGRAAGHRRGDAGELPPAGRQDLDPTRELTYGQSTPTAASVGPDRPGPDRPGAAVRTRRPTPPCPDSSTLGRLVGGSVRARKTSRPTRAAGCVWGAAVGRRRT
ncbi:hypothetical protein [Micromonospora sp. WMMA1363]|uniref:hypothetical protein n=1 Tax=Micromonospora sp. WMMA1363 TaxID=3053985 RepID=UPI00338DDA77